MQWRICGTKELLGMAKRNSLMYWFWQQKGAGIYKLQVLPVPGYYQED